MRTILGLVIAVAIAGLLVALVPDRAAHSPPPASVTE